MVGQSPDRESGEEGSGLRREGLEDKDRRGSPELEGETDSRKRGRDREDMEVDGDRGREGRDRDSDRDRERSRSNDREDERRERGRERDRRDDSFRDEKRANHGTRDVSNVESSLRFLVPNSLAGAIIGKGGAVISEFQSQSGAKIVLSRTREFFPSTLDRILMLNGNVNAILTALHLVLSKLDEEERSKGSPKREGGRVLDLKIVVPNRVCGALIGKSGATIRSFGEDSGASLKISPQDSSHGAVGERIITIMGTVEQQLRAVALILAKAAEDPSYLSYADVPLSYTASGGAPVQPPPRGAAVYSRNPMPGMRSRSPPLLSAQPGSTTIIVAVPDEHVGSVVGKGGNSLRDIIQQSGARIEVSSRGDFVEGTSNRKLTITGAADCVVAAQHLIAQRVQSSIQMATQGGRGRGRDDYRDNDRDGYRDGGRDRDNDRDRGDGRGETGREWRGRDRD